MTVRRRTWVGLGIVASAVALLLLGLAGRHPAPDVNVARAYRQQIESWISTNGTVEPIHPFILRARLDTFVASVPVAEGQTVRKGQLLAVLDGSAALAQLAQARQNLLAARRQLQYAQAGGPPDVLAQLASDIAKTQASLDHLKSQNQALQTLVAEHAATRDELAQNQLQLKQTEASLQYLHQRKQDLARQAGFDAAQAQLQIEQAQARIRDLSEKVASTRVLSPLDGTVYALSVKAGDFVQIGQPVVSVADLRHVRVRAYVDEVDLGSLASGDYAQVQWDGLPGRMWKGAVERLPKQVVPYGHRRVGEALCSIDSLDQRLLPNTNVDIKIRVGQQTGALVVPRAAIRGQEGDHYVFLIVNGDRLRRQPVKVGLASSDRFEVLSGLTEGQQVALPSASILSDGMEIHPVEVR